MVFITNGFRHLVGEGLLCIGSAGAHERSVQVERVGNIPFFFLRTEIIIVVIATVNLFVVKKSTKVGDGFGARLGTHGDVK